MTRSMTACSPRHGSGSVRGRTLRQSLGTGPYIGSDARGVGIEHGLDALRLVARRPHRIAEPDLPADEGIVEALFSERGAPVAIAAENPQAEPVEQLVAERDLAQMDLVDAAAGLVGELGEPLELAVRERVAAFETDLQRRLPGDLAARTGVDDDVRAGEIAAHAAEAFELERGQRGEVAPVGDVAGEAVDGQAVPLQMRVAEIGVEFGDLARLVIEREVAGGRAEARRVGNAAEAAFAIAALDADGEARLRRVLEARSSGRLAQREVREIGLRRVGAGQRRVELVVVAARLQAPVRAEVDVERGVARALGLQRELGVTAVDERCRAARLVGVDRAVDALLRIPADARLRRVLVVIELVEVVVVVAPPLEAGEDALQPEPVAGVDA